MNTEIKQLCRQLSRRGFVVRPTGGGHIRIEHAKLDGPVFGPSTPSDRRAVKNLQAEIRR
jgi:predicted RNA binding protein YcfA (HicA-like mRNA interferase family)